MKKQLLFIGAAFAISNALMGQSTIKNISVPIPKELNKSSIIYADKNENNQIEIILATKVKKETNYKQFVFDTDLSKLKEIDITIDQFKDKSKNTLVDGKQQLPRFVQVNSTMLFQELKVEKGYLLRTITSFDGYAITRDEMVVEEIMSVKTDDNRKLVPIYTYYLGDNPVKPSDLGFKEPGYYAKGDMMVVCEVFPKLMVKEEKEPRIGVGASRVPLDYCVLRFNTETLTPISKTLINFDHVQVTEGVKEISGKRLVLLTKDYKGKAPKSMGWEKYYNEGSNKHTLTLIDKESKVQAQFSFEGISDMEIWNIEELASGSIVITGKVYDKKNSRFIIAKCTGQKLDFISEIPANEFQSNISKPVSDKKFLTFDNTLQYNACDYKGMLELPNKHILIVYQQKDGAKRSNLYYLQFDEDGKFFKQYTHSLKEEYTALYNRPNGNFPIALTLNINPDNTLSILLQEEIEGKGKYMGIGKIDFGKGLINEFTYFGIPTKEDKNAYYLDKNNPYIELANDEIILLGRSEKKDFLWLNKVSVK